MNLILSLWILVCSQSASSNQNESLVKEMNSIRFTEYGDFSKNWKLVTVRFRQDTHEMRFTYANDLAWQTLQKGDSNYPDGSVFAKVGYKSGVDPMFNSSIVPSGARRFQYMVKNSKRYLDTNGWGYALFNSSGDLFEGDVKTATQSCHACHTVVKQKDYIFSEPIENSPLVTTLRATYSLDKVKDQIAFQTFEASDSIGEFKATLTSYRLKKINIVSGSMREYFFGGTLDEITPILINFVLKMKISSAFLSLDQKTFKIVKLAKKNKCAEGQHTFEVIEKRQEWPDTKPTLTLLCYDKSNVL